MTATTTGLNTAARVKITSSAPMLILSPTNTGQLLTYQIEVTVTDVAGNVLDPQPELYYDLLAGFHAATVSDTGLVTGEAEGNVIVQVACASFGNKINLFTPAGLPVNAITAEQNVKVVEGYVLPDFYFRLDYADGTFTITQHPETDSTWNGTVTYTLGPSNAKPTVLGTITGSGTLTFTGADSTTNFIVQATASDGRYHQVWTSWGNPQSGPASTITYPVTSSRGQNGSASGTSDSGISYAA